MGRPARLLVAVGVLAVIGFGADRLAAHADADRIATTVQSDAHLSHRPSVTVGGFPFLVQVVKGRYDHIGVTVNDLFESGLQEPTVLRLEFGGVHIAASDILNGGVHHIAVDKVTGVAAIPFADLQTAAHVVGLSGLTAVPGSANEVRFTEAVSVAGVKVDVQITARVTVANGSVVVTARDVVAGGTPLPAAVTNSVLSHAAFSVKLPGLPAGVQVSGVTVTPTDVLVSVSATHLVLTR
jgi:hypothetical protein